MGHARRGVRKGRRRGSWAEEDVEMVHSSEGRSKEQNRPWGEKGTALNNIPKCGGFSHASGKFIQSRLLFRKRRVNPPPCNIILREYIRMFPFFLKESYEVISLCL